MGVCPISHPVRFIFVAALLSAAFFSGSVRPSAAACGGTPAVSTDKPDYGPTETVMITGSGFGCGVQLTVIVRAPDGSTWSADGTGSPGPDTVITAGDGTFVFNYQLSGTRADGIAYEGQLGQYSVKVLDQSDVVVASTNFGDAMGFFSCALTSSGGVKCWGSNTFGSLGNGTFSQAPPYGSATPVDVVGLTSGVVQVSAGYLHACALTTGGGVKCWGRNNEGQLGNGQVTQTVPQGIPTPVDVIGLSSGAVQVSAGVFTTCAVLASGGAKCWGSGANGQMGNGTFLGTNTPGDVQGLTDAVQISVGLTHACAVTAGGGVKCWGSGDGVVGTGTNIPQLTPADVSGLSSGVKQVKAGGFTTCAVMLAGGVKCWGYGGYGVLGNGTFTTTNTPVDVVGFPDGATQLSVGFHHACAVTTNGSVLCWGWGLCGGLGDGTYGVFSSTPVNVSGLPGSVVQVSLGNYHACALTESGGAACWGGNMDGQLGTGTFTLAPPWGSAAPEAVSGLTSDVAQLWDSDSIANTDLEPPTASPTQSPPANGLGWNNADVLVSWNWSDAGSGIDAANCTQSSTSSGEGDPLTLGANCSDLSGNTGSVSYTVKVDKTPPSVALEGGPSVDTYYFGSVPPAPACAGSDSLSGLNTCTVSGYSTAVGSHTVIATATDRAGHSSAVSTTYTVRGWTLSGFHQPVDIGDVVNTVKNGATVPIKFEVFAGSTELIDTSIIVQPLKATQMFCDGGPADDIELLANGNTSLRYDSTGGQFVYNWQTPKLPGYCYVVTVTLKDGTSQSAKFRLK